MELQQYFERVRFRGDSRPNYATLVALHKSHVCAVPFENIDVQLRRPLTTDIEAIYEKIVVNGRGGWCYEQNGLFGWALTQLGFEVTRIAANVMRQSKGQASAASHLCLMVKTPDEQGQTWLADVGFGGSLYTPIELVEADYNQPPYRLGIRRLDDGHWQFWEDIGSGDFSYDFLPQPADETALSNKCSNLQTDPASSFVLNLVAQLRLPDTHKSLRGRVLKILAPNGESMKTLESAAELVETLQQTFGLSDPEVGDLWPAVVARHEQLFTASN